VNVKRRWKIGIAAVALVAIAAVAALTMGNHDPEPEYKGRKLSDWIIEGPEFPGGYDSKIISETRRTSRVVAVLAMGTNALPWLVRWAGYESPHMPFSLQRKIPILRNYFQRRALLRTRAYQIFIPLGTDAAPAIPLIEQKLQELPPSDAAQGLGRALACMGPAGATALGDSVTNTNIALENRLFLIRMLSLRYKYPMEPEPNLDYIRVALTNCLADPSPQIRRAVQVYFQPMPISR
jgi:hypothetical protein